MAHAESQATISTFVQADANAPRFYLYGHRRLGGAVGLCLSTFLSLLDTTIVAVALPRIGAEFKSYDRTIWIVTAYLISYVAFLPIFAKLGGIIGSKYVLLFSCIIFIAFSGACGGANTMNQLIVFRALQGIGGSALWSCSTTCLLTMFPPEVLPKYIAITPMTYAMASVLGPILGGVIVANVSWAWIFWINLPLGVVTFALIFLSLHGKPLRSFNLAALRGRIDWIGAFLVLVMLLLFSLAVQLGGQQFSWHSKQVLVPLIVSILSVPALVLVELRVLDPIIPLKLLKLHRNIALNMLCTLCIGAGFFGTAVMLPQRMQVVDLLSSKTAGVRMLPMLFTAGLVSTPIAIIISKTRTYLAPLRVCLALASIAAGLLTLLDYPTPFAKQYGFEALLGTVLGLSITIATVVFQYPILPVDVPVAQGILSTARMLGALLGVSLSATILNTYVRRNLRLDARLVQAIMKAPDLVIPTLDPGEADAVRGVYSRGYRRVFISTAVWLAVAAVMALFMEQLPAPSAVRQAEGGQSGSSVNIVEENHKLGNLARHEDESV